MDDTAPRDFALAPIATRTLWLSALLIVVLPVLLVVVATAMHPNSAAAQRFAPQLLLGPGICLLVWASLALATRRRRLILAGDLLTVRSTFYTSHLPLGALDLDRARVFDREEHTELRPAGKRNGIGLPGLHSGHFTLRNGQRAFVAVAGGRWRVWLPRRDGGAGLLLEPADARDLLDVLRARAPRGTHAPPRVAAPAGKR
ncbi:MAG TPA: hypothetical protein VD865_18065 [Stenotrophomonas sp.]|nr:hypothetical protein [Stenotrophomonas sp.]